jgi:uncharacterized repeat protein (TIGR03803 family)
MTRHRLGLTIAAVLIAIFGLLAAPSALASDTFKPLYQFSKAEKANGEAPHGGLISDSAGDLYGTTFEGGTGTGTSMLPRGADSPGTPGGTVYELIPNGSGGWTQTVLYSFCGVADCTDGSNPVDQVIFDANGNLYGVADLGGDAGVGVVYELKPGSEGTWIEEVLYSFCPVAGCADGSEPWGGLIFDASGNLYGTTKQGGAFGHGVAFELSPGTGGAWTETVLYSFCALANCADGAQIQGTQIFDAKGNLYGTTYAGGVYTDDGCIGVKDTCGTVYELSPDGNGKWTEKVLHSFNFKDGAGSETALIFDTKGNLYGTTTRGGYQTGGIGVAFELSPKTGGEWSETVLHSFPGSDGYSLGPLIFDASGNLYGTVNGHLSTSGKGGVFKLVPGTGGTWKEDVLHTFSGNDGQGPTGGLYLDKKNNIYGTTFSGGAGKQGVVYEITQ